MRKHLKRAARRLAQAPALLWRRGIGLVQRLRADPKVRDLALAHAVFAGIFAFGVGAIDFLITGGPDWNPGGVAYAQEAPLRRAPSALLQTVAYELPPALPEQPEWESDGSPVGELLGGPTPMLTAAEDEEFERALEAIYERNSAKPAAIALIEPLSSPDKLKEPDAL